jgi:uncharacterized membrane protein
MRLLLLVLTLLASALAAGFFYTYQWSAMPGLDAANPQAAIPVMQGINRVVRNAVFAFSFFGTLGFGLLTTIVLFAQGPRDAAWCALAGTLLYGVGTFAVTFMFNVPLNEQLAAVTPTAETAADTWRDYYAPWMRWNLLRALCAIAALLAFVASFYFWARQPSAT